MALTRSVSKKWDEAFERLFQKSPYIGPRPQTSMDKGMLIGREAEIKYVARAVRNKQLVVIDGYSGTGKSSLLENGVFERLKSFGFTVCTVSSWGKLPNPVVSDVDAFIAKSIDVDLDEGETSVCSALDKQHGGSAVLVLDQFEEMLRQEEQPFLSVVGEWIVSSIRHCRTHIVISLRTDSIHRLEPLLRGIRPFSQERVHLEELDREEDIRAIIHQTQKWCLDQTVIRPEARELILELWRKHQPPLLCLQACLFALFFRAQNASPSGQRGGDNLVPIAVQNVQELQDMAPDQDFFSYALREAIQVRMAQAESAARDARLDEYLVVGTRELVKRMAPLLSSGDHKVPIAYSELAFRLLDEELRVLRGPLLELKENRPNDGRRMSDREFLSNLVADISKSVSLGTVRPSLQSTSEGVPRDVTAGPMMGKTATETLRWEVERVNFAVRWLKESKLLREDSNGILLLIHDGVGPALNAWANSQETDPLSATRRLTASKGERFDWEDRSLQGEKGDTKFLMNLNWRECRISAGTIRHIAFVNCDFTASRFDNCVLEGVTFINCTLDDANFEGCKIVGGARLELSRGSEGSKEGVIQLAPSFTVEAPSEAGNYARYLGRQEGEVFFSDTTGVPASLGDEPEAFQGETLANFVGLQRLASQADRRASSQIERDVSPVEGGIAIVGGRICSLTLHRCSSDQEDKGALILDRVAGSGLDIVEFSGMIEIRGAAIRGISVSVDPEVQKTTVRLNVRNSLVANTCFSQNLKGSAVFSDCTVIMLLNANRDPRTCGREQAFTVELKDCRYQFIANAYVIDVDCIEDSQLPDFDPSSPGRLRYFNHVENTHSRCTLSHREPLALLLEAMDFRSRPEEWEHRQRRLYPGRKARSLLIMATWGGTPLPEGRNMLEEAVSAYQKARERLGQDKREALRLQGEAALVGYLLLYYDSDKAALRTGAAPFLDETVRIKDLAAQEGFKDIEGWSDINIDVMKRGAFSGWRLYDEPK